jgi:hypothetical protein
MTMYRNFRKPGAKNSLSLLEVDYLRYLFFTDGKLTSTENFITLTSLSHSLNSTLVLKTLLNEQLLYSNLIEVQCIHTHTLQHVHMHMYTHIILILQYY